MRRIMSNAYYDFLYVPISTGNSTSAIILNGDDLSLYAYEFLVDEKNIGGTLHLDFATRLMVGRERAFHGKHSFCLASCFTECQCQCARLPIEESTAHLRVVRS